MILQVFKAILLTSLVGSILAIILLLLKPVTKRIFGSAWQYYTWAIVLFVMMMPVTIKLPQPAPVVPVSQTIQIPQTEMAVQAEKQPAQNVQAQAVNTTPLYNNTMHTVKNISLSITDVFSYVWLIGCLIVFTINIIRYSIFLRTIHKNSIKVSLPELGTDKIITRRTDMIDAPLMIGLFRPTLLLPNREMTEESLNYILLHELTHYKRHDILYKWFVMLVSTVHWFNPFVYIVSKQIDEECEISCDLSVVANMSEQEQKNYMHTILSFVTQKDVKSRLLTTAMVSNKKMIKRRVIMIKKMRKTKKATAIISAITACVILVTTVFASGVLANEVLKDDYQIEVYNGEALLTFTNKPFIENGEVYLPLRETLEHFVDLSEAISEIIWNDNGDIVVNLFDKDSKIIIEDGQIVYAHLYHYRLKIGVSEVYVGDKIDFLLSSPPVLQNDTTYVPLKVIENIKIESGFLDGFFFKY